MTTQRTVMKMLEKRPVLCSGEEHSTNVTCRMWKIECVTFLDLWIWIRRFPDRMSEGPTSFFYPHMTKYEKRQINLKKNSVKFQPQFRETIKEPGLSDFKHKLFLISIFIQEKILNVRNGFRAKTESRAPPRS